MTSRTQTSQSLAVRPNTLEFLRWVAARLRTYAETMVAWQTSCPRFSIWEDSLIDGLVRLENGNFVTLTPRGRAIVDGATSS